MSGDEDTLVESGPEGVPDSPPADPRSTWRRGRRLVHSIAWIVVAASTVVVLAWRVPLARPWLELGPVNLVLQRGAPAGVPLDPVSGEPVTGVAVPAETAPVPTTEPPELDLGKLTGLDLTDEEEACLESALDERRFGRTPDMNNPSTRAVLLDALSECIGSTTTAAPTGTAAP